MATYKKYKNKRTGEELYAFKIYLGTDPVTGKRIQTTRRGFKSKPEAKSACAKLELEYQQNGWKKNQNEIKTFSQLFDIWFETYQKTVKHSTATEIWTRYKRYIKPSFGSLRLKSLRVSYCQKIVNQWSSKYRAYRAIKNLTAQILNYAVTLEIIDSNPMKKIVTPRTKKGLLHKREDNFYSKEELNYFFECLDKIGNQKYIAFFRVLAFTGIRKSEALALQWKDIDFAHASLKISKTVYIDARLKRVIVQEPKTAASKRTLDMDAKTLSILKVWRHKQREELLAQGFNSLSSEQFVFTQYLGNGLPSPTNVNNWLEWIYRKYPQKEITAHGFRHTHASLLFEAGATLKEVQDRLGHANVKTTLNIYTHVTKKARKNTASKFAKYIDN